MEQIGLMMKESFGELWEMAPAFDAVCITTNGWTKTNGEAVMGRGVAKEAAQRYEGIAKTLGLFLQKRGNYPHILVHDKPSIVSFPVKPVWGPNGEMGWKAKADVDLIRDSAEALMLLADEEGWKSIALPRPGCGNGGLKWEDVKLVIEPILDDRVTVVTWHP